MPLHPQSQAMIDALAAGPALDYSTLTAANFRAAFDVPAPAEELPTCVRVENRVVDLASNHSIHVWLYYPEGDGPFPMTLYLHGGGFVIGSPATTDGICRTLAAVAGSLVVSVDYRLAPETRFPGGLDDAFEALTWLHAHADELNGVASKIAVAGDSSGGNFAAVLAQQARAKGPALCHQLLLYPVLDCRFTTGSYREFERGYFLSAEMMRWFWRQYLGNDEAAHDVRASPLRQRDLAGVAGATIFTAEYDVLRDEGEAYALSLRSAGIDVELKRWPGQIHGFLLMQGNVDDAHTALIEAGVALRKAFHAWDSNPRNGSPE
jgi:acetyl esterase